MSSSWILSLRKEIAVEDGDEGELALTGPYFRLVLRGLSPVLIDALRSLAYPGASEGRLAESIHAAEGGAALARWCYHLQQFARRGALLVSIRAGREPLATLEPMAPGFDFTGGTPVADRAYRLSRFAYLRRRDDETVLESPRAFARVVLHDDRVAALIHNLARPMRVRDLRGRVLGLQTSVAVQVLGLIAAAGVLEGAGDDGTTAEDENPSLQCWEFHDLLFHARSREGRHDAPVGATYRMAGFMPPPPALKPITAAETVELYRPDLEQLQREDPPFALVQERRRSIRSFGREPITERQLGEFLYRVGRVKDLQEWDAATPAGPIHIQAATRPYPAGGGLYELELYAVVNVCTGLAPGLYHYDPLGHRLGRVSDRTPEVEALLRNAGTATGTPPETFQVLLILASRFPRVAWKYASLSYALTLKHVGVVFQTMYLAATAMGLAPCAVGAGDSDLFARAIDGDYYEETSVGEFLLGSKG